MTWNKFYASKNRFVVLRHCALRFDVSACCSTADEKFLDFSKLKAFADDKSDVEQILELVLNGTENIVKKGKMMVTSIFSFSSNVFNNIYPRYR